MTQANKTDDKKSSLMQVSDYEFKAFDKKVDPTVVVNYQFNDFSKEVKEKKIELKQKSMQEMTQAVKSGFFISPLVKQYRGHNQAERDEKDLIIKEEVERRVTILRKKVEEEAYKEGLERGKQEVFQELMKATEEKLVDLNEMINGLMTQQADLMIKNRDLIYKMVKNLVKWMTLKEISNDKDYTQRLLEKLIQEIESKTGLLLLVNPKDFEKMPEILEKIKSKYEGVDNIRVEIDPQIQEHGIILESENGILNATIEEQFLSLNKLFEAVGINEGS